MHGFYSIFTEHIIHMGFAHIVSPNTVKLSEWSCVCWFQVTK